MRADVCVIGSGAGGAVVAKELAEAGMRVVLLEEGEHITAEPSRPARATCCPACTATPPSTRRSAARRSCCRSGARSAGTTLVNSGTCFRTPDAVLERWRTELGLHDLTPDALAPHFERVERELNVSPSRRSWPAPTPTSRAAAPRRSAGRATSSTATCAAASARACAPTAAPRTPSSTSASPMSRRRHAAGATDLHGRPRTTHRPPRPPGDRRRGGDPGGGRLRVQAGTVVVAAGAIHTPALLARNGLGGGSGQLGRNLSLHPATAVWA